METAMPLNENQARELRELIERRRAALLAELQEDAARSREQPYAELAGPAPDIGDQSVATLIADLGEADLSRDLDELRGLDSARERMAAGGYGVCVECAADIGFERLKAAPGATRCIACQARHEKTYGGEPKPRL
jgi:RNA polymerase-binding transcription factor DksA